MRSSLRQSFSTMGCIKFPTPCDVQIMIILYMLEKCLYMGCIPNDQEAFFKSIRQMYESHRKQQVQKQKANTTGISVNSNPMLMPINQQQVTQSVQQIPAPPPHQQVPAPQGTMNQSQQQPLAQQQANGVQFSQLEVARKENLMPQDAAKKKCSTFFSKLILADEQNMDFARSVRQLVQEFIDGTIQAEEFTSNLSIMFHCAPKPFLVSFLKRNVPLVRYFLLMKEVIIDGVRPPPRGVFSLPCLATLSDSQSLKDVGCQALVRLADNLNSPDSVVYYAWDILTKVRQDNLLKGRSLSVASSAVIFVSYKEAGCLRRHDEICRVHNIRRKDLNKCITIIQEHLGLDKLILGENYVPHFGDKLGVSDNVKAAAINISRRASELEIARGVKPESLAAAALYFACELSETKSMNEISVASGVSVGTVRKICKLLKENGF